MAQSRRRALRRSGGPDPRTMAETFAYPGIDPRQWFSYGLVAQDAPFEFDPDYGPLIAVELQPSGVEVNCRVGMQVAGDGEAEYHPFVEGDEVAVLIPQGNERGDCLIVARCSNARAPFPSGSVGGQDPTKNSFGFSRRRTPYIQELAGPILLRQATSGAFLSLDEAGVITLRDGQRAALQLSPDLFGYQSGDAKFLMQLNLTGGRFTLQVDDSILTLSSSSASPQANALAVPGPFSLGTLANPAIEHVLTTESFTHFLTFILQAVGAVAVPPFVVTPVQVAAAIATAIPLATVAPQNPAVGALLVTTFGSGSQKPPGVPGLGQVFPSIGCQGFTSG